MLSSYHVLIVIVAILSTYGLSALLVNLKKITLLKHRRFWNYLLLISFLISGLLGLLLAVLIEYKLSVAWYREFLWFHVEFGIAMAVLSIIHIIWHWRYFKFRKKDNIQT